MISEFRGDSTETRTWDEKREITLSMRRRRAHRTTDTSPSPIFRGCNRHGMGGEPGHPNRNWLMRNGNAIERILA